MVTNGIVKIRKAVLIALIAAAAVLLLLSALVSARYIILSGQSRRAVITESFMLADKSLAASKNGDPALGARLALEGLPSAADIRPYADEALAALAEAVSAYDLGGGFKQTGKVYAGGVPSSVRVSEDGAFIAVCAGGRVFVYDAETAANTGEPQAAGGAANAAFADIDGEGCFIFADGFGITRYNPAAKTARSFVNREGLSKIAVSGDGKFIAALDTINGEVYVVNPQGTFLNSLKPEGVDIGAFAAKTSALAVSEGGEYLCASFGSKAFIWDMGANALENPGGEVIGRLENDNVKDWQAVFCGGLLALCGDYYDGGGSVSVYDMGKKNEEFSDGFEAGVFRAAAYDGKLYISGRGLIKGFNGAESFTLPNGANIDGLAAGGGNIIASSKDGRLFIINEDGGKYKTFGSDYPFGELAVSGGTALAAGAFEPGVRVLTRQPVTGSPMFSFGESAGYTDGQIIGGDKRLALWGKDFFEIVGSDSQKLVVQAKYQNNYVAGTFVDNDRVVIMEEKDGARKITTWNGKTGDYMGSAPAFSFLGAVFTVSDMNAEKSRVFDITGAAALDANEVCVGGASYGGGARFVYAAQKGYVITLYEFTARGGRKELARAEGFGAQTAFITEGYAIIAPERGAAAVISIESGKPVKSLGANDGRLTDVREYDFKGMPKTIAVKHERPDGTIYAELLNAETLGVWARVEGFCGITEDLRVFVKTDGEVRYADYMPIGALRQAAARMPGARALTDSEKAFYGLKTVE